MQKKISKENHTIKNTKIKVFQVPVSLEYSEESIFISDNGNIKYSKEDNELVNKAIKSHQNGRLSEASKSYQYLINKNLNDPRIFSNYGAILKSLGKFKEAEFYFRKAISIQPNFSDAYNNLGSIMMDLNRLHEAELYIRKSIQLKPNNPEALSNMGNILNNLGKTKEAKIFVNKAIELNPNHAMAYSNLGGILMNLGKLKNAELSIRKAIELNPNLPEAYNNLGNILKDIGRLEESEKFQIKAIEMRTDYAKAYFDLSTLQYSNNNLTWKNRLFSRKILANKPLKDKVDIYFARANVLHKEKDFINSGKHLVLANKYKLDLKPSNYDFLIKNSKDLFIESCEEDENKNYLVQNNDLQNIFIVGMPRSGSTLLESIISMNIDVEDLGETDLLRESYMEWKKIKKANNKSTLYDIYYKNVNTNQSELRIKTNKNLYNYQYVGIIAKYIPNARIIHCYRNPLDNIVSI